MPLTMVASFDDVPIAVHDLGGTGPAALFTPGAGLVASMFGALAHELSAELSGYAVDPRGHGRSGFPADRHLGWHDFGADLLAVVDALDLEAPVGVGHSLGGAALLLAELARPGTFSLLYLYEPISIPEVQRRVQADANPLIELALRRRQSFDSLEEATAHLRRRPLYAAMPEDVLGAYLGDGLVVGDDDTVTLACPGEQEALVYRSIGSNDTFERLGEIACPTLVAGGAATTGIPSEFVTSIASRIPGCELEWFDDLDHFGPFTHPALVADSVRRFVATARA